MVKVHLPVRCLTGFSTQLKNFPPTIYSSFQFFRASKMNSIILLDILYIFKQCIIIIIIIIHEFFKLI